MKDFNQAQQQPQQQQVAPTFCGWYYSPFIGWCPGYRYGYGYPYGGYGYPYGGYGYGYPYGYGAYPYGFGGYPYGYGGYGYGYGRPGIYSNEEQG